MNLIATFDLDSTLCDTGHRHHIIDRVNGTDWDVYSQACSGDTLIPSTAAMINICLAAGMDVHYVTGRKESARPQTLEWLLRNGLPTPSANLWMDSSPVQGDDFVGFNSHAEYKVHQIRNVEKETGKTVAIHFDDWAEVAVELEKNNIRCVCVRTPQEVSHLTGGADNASLF